MGNRIAALLVVAATALTFPIAAVAESPQYLGEFCWRVQSNSPDEPLVATLQLGVLYYGRDHYPLHGKISYAEGVLVVSGNAEITRNGIEATLHATGTSIQFREVYGINLQFDQNLNGYYRTIGFESMGGFTPEDLTDEGTMTPVACP